MKEITVRMKAWSRSPEEARALRERLDSAANPAEAAEAIDELVAYTASLEMSIWVPLGEAVITLHLADEPGAGT